MALTLASCAAQKAWLTAAVRFLGGPRLATRDAFATEGEIKTKGTEATSAKGELTEANWALARPQ